MASPRSLKGLAAGGGDARTPLLDASESFHGDVEMQTSVLSSSLKDGGEDGGASPTSALAAAASKDGGASPSSAPASGPSSERLRSSAPASVRFLNDEAGEAPGAAASDAPASSANAPDAPALSPSDQALAAERARLGRWSRFSHAVSKRFRVDPSAQGIDVDGLDPDDPFNQELGHGEFLQNYLPSAMSKSCRNAGMNNTSISVVLHREINPWFHLFYQIITCGLFDALFLRRYYRLFTVENRMAMTNVGRILLWTREAKGQRLSFTQTLVTSVTSPLVVNACFVLFAVTMSGSLFRVLGENWFPTTLNEDSPWTRVMDDFAVFGVIGLIVIMFVILIGACWKYLHSRLGLSLYTNMQAFVASDLCASSFLLSETKFCGRRRTRSQSRLFFGRYPTQADLSAGPLFPDIGLVNTQPPISNAAPAAAETSRGTAGSSEEETSGSNTLFIVGALSNLLLMYSVMQWILTEIMIDTWIPWINIQNDFWKSVAVSLQIKDDVEEGKRTPYTDQLANVAATALIFLSIKTVSEAVLRSFNRTRPNAQTTSQKESSAFTNTTDNQFDSNVEHMRYFLSSLSAHAVRFGEGFRPPPPEVFLKHAKGRKNFGRMGSTDTTQSHGGGLYSFSDSVESIRKSECFAGDDDETIRKKFEPYIRLLPVDDPIHQHNTFCPKTQHSHEGRPKEVAEAILAVYPMARSTLLKYKLLSILTCGIYPLLIRCRVIRRTHGAVVLTNARLIQISLSCTLWGWAIKMDSFILDNSLKSCTIHAPCPLPCTWNLASSTVLFSSRLGPLEIKLPGAKWFGKPTRRMWQALSMVRSRELTLRKGLGLPGDDEKPQAVAAWLHLTLVAITRLELRVRDVEICPSIMPKAVPGKFYDWEVISSISGAALQREAALENSKKMERDETGAVIGERKPPGGYFVTVRKSPIEGWSFAFSDGHPEHIITDLGSLGGSTSGLSTSMKVVSWLSMPEMYNKAIKLEVNQSALLVAAIWIPGFADELAGAAVGPAMSHNVSDFSQGAAVGPAMSTNRSRRASTDWDDQKGWGAGIKAGWKPFGSEWQPPKVAGDYGRCVCYSLKVKNAKEITIPERPLGIALTIFGGQLLWDIIPGIQNEDADGKVHTCEFPREHTEEVQWETCLIHERPDFFRMRIDIPLIKQKWTITNHRVINFKIEPLTGLWTKIRNCNRCFASPPRETLTFIPLENIKGFQTEEAYTMTNTCFGRCARKCVGRNTDNRSFITMKLLTRVGRDRCFTEGGAVTSLSYLDPKAPGSNEKERITDASFYMDSLKELRVWASAADLANLASDAGAAGSSVFAHTAVVPSAEREEDEPSLDPRDLESPRGVPDGAFGRERRASTAGAASFIRRKIVRQEILWHWLMNPSSSTAFRGWQPRHASGSKSNMDSFVAGLDKVVLGHPFQHWKKWWQEQRQQKNNWSRLVNKILRCIHAHQCAGLVAYGHALKLLAGKMSLKLDSKKLETVHSTMQHLKDHTHEAQAQSEAQAQREHTHTHEAQELEETDEDMGSILRETR